MGYDAAYEQAIDHHKEVEAALREEAAGLESRVLRVMTERDTLRAEVETLKGDIALLVDSHVSMGERCKGYLDERDEARGRADITLDQLDAAVAERNRYRTQSQQGISVPRELIGACLNHHHVNHPEWNAAAEKWMKSLPGMTASATPTPEPEADPQHSGEGE